MLLDDLEIKLIDIADTLNIRGKRKGHNVHEYFDI